MKLTAFTDYSLRVLIFLAIEPDRRTTIAEIALAFGISENHLTKVVHFLGQAGYVTTVRGKGGGMTLGQPAETIGIGAVVRRTEPATQPAPCFSVDGDCRIVAACQLRGVLDRAVDAYLAVLDRCTLADLVRNRRALAPLLFMARADE